MPDFAAEWTLGGSSRVVCTGWAHGDMAGDGPAVERRRASVLDAPWTLLNQVHGARVVVVDEPGASSGTEADAAVTTCPGAALGVLTADCAPVALASDEGVIGIAHAGWRGLRAGVIEATVQSMRRLGATKIEAVLGPCIHACCYEFGESELFELSRRFGDGVQSVTSDGKPALDMQAGVAAALHLAGATLVGSSPQCTGHSGGLWSWRTQQATRRQVTLIWRP